MLRNELTIVYVSNSNNSNYELLIKLYNKLNSIRDIKFEFVLSSPSADYSNLNANIKFASNKNNVICVKAKENTLYSSLRAALHVANYKVTLLLDNSNLTNETIDNFNVLDMLDETNIYSDFKVNDIELGYAMKTFYMKNMVNEVKFNDTNIYEEMLYTSGADILVTKANKRKYKKYFRIGKHLKQLYGV